MSDFSAPSSSLDDLVKVLSAKVDAFQLRSGILYAIGTGTVSVRIGGSTQVTTNIPYMDTLSPYVGAKVWVAQWGTQLLVLGEQTAFGAGLPPGTVLDHWSDINNVPAGFLLCYGQTVTSADTTYPGLWAWAPAAAKSGTSLTLPDLRGRMTIGLDNMGGSDAGRISTANTIGATGGAASVTLTTTELPSHTHSTPSHSHSVSIGYGGTTSNDGYHNHGGSTGATYVNTVTAVHNAADGGTGDAQAWGDYHSHSISGDGSHTHTFGGTVSGSTASDGSGTSGSAGSGLAFSILPPHFVINKIIKV